MPRVFSFISWSGTGKTTYLEGLIAALKARGLRVAAVKHDGHRLDLDREGKDSWRFAKAGADVVAVADAEKCAVMDYRPRTLSDVLGQVRDVDVVLVERWHAEAERCPVPCFPLDDPAPLADFLLAQL